MVKIDWTPRRKRIAAIVMLAIVILLSINIIQQFGSHLLWRRWVTRNTVVAIATTQPAATQAAESRPAGSMPESAPASRPGTADSQSTTTSAPASVPASSPAPDRSDRESKKKTGESPPPAELNPAIKKRNPFLPVTSKPAGHGLRLTGVIGNIALFARRDGQTIGIGQGESAEGVTVKSITEYQVTIEFEGKSETLNLFGEGASGQGPVAEDESRPRMGGMPDRPQSPEEAERMMKEMKEKMRRRGAR